MPPIHYTRNDVTIRIRRDGDAMRIEIADAFLTLDPSEVMTIAASWPPVAALRVSASGPDEDLPRVTLRIEEPEWAAIDWESIFVDPASWPSQRRPVVRVSPVPARVLQYPFRPPARVVEIGVPRVVEAAVRNTLSGPHAADVVTVSSAELWTVMEIAQTERWPAAHILHFHDLGMVGTALLDESSAVAGSLGWILRTAMRWSTRLIVLE